MLVAERLDVGHAARTNRSGNACLEQGRRSHHLFHHFAGEVELRRQLVLVEDWLVEFHFARFHVVLAPRMVVEEDLLHLRNRHFRLSMWMILNGKATIESREEVEDPSAVEVERRTKHQRKMRVFVPRLVISVRVV